MKITDLDFSYPEELVATERALPSRLMLVRGDEPAEISVRELKALFAPGDVLVINTTKVIKRRIFSQSGLEIFFLSRVEGCLDWTALCPSSRWKQNTKQFLPEGIELELVARGRPQIVRPSRELSDGYFEKNGELPLPPYIQKARGERHNRRDDAGSYQTAWAENPGSLAAPTASLHFSQADLADLRARDVEVCEVTLHVGLGTFLPVTTETLEEHEMHFEMSEIPQASWQKIQSARSRGHHIWALGTTVARTLESAAHGKLAPQGEASDYAFKGETNLFILPGFEYKVVDRLLTNFHQPQSTLLALVAAFSGLETVQRCYQWAIARNFRLFSYGDLSVWIR